MLFRSAGLLKELVNQKPKKTTICFLSLNPACHWLTLSIGEIDQGESLQKQNGVQFKLNLSPVLGHDHGMPRQVSVEATHKFEALTQSFAPNHLFVYILRRAALPEAS